MLKLVFRWKLTQSNSLLQADCRPPAWSGTARSKAAFSTSEKKERKQLSLLNNVHFIDMFSFLIWIRLKLVAQTPKYQIRHIFNLNMNLRKGGYKGRSYSIKATCRQPPPQFSLASAHFFLPFIIDTLPAVALPNSLRTTDPTTFAYLLISLCLQECQTMHHQDDLI